MTEVLTPKLIVFASGTKDGGGSGFANLVQSTRSDPKILNAEIVAVVSNYEKGGVAQKAANLQIPFEHFPGPWTAQRYRDIVKKYEAEWIALSGWLKYVEGLDPIKTFNIHPGILPKLAGLYGHYVHEAAIEAYKRGEIEFTAVMMHFVGGGGYDTGPVFYCGIVDINDDDTPKTLAERVRKHEHLIQPRITNLVVSRQIWWDGENPDSLVVPPMEVINKNLGLVDLSVYRK